MSTAGYLQDAKNQQARLANILTNKGITASATEKYDSLVSKVEQIEELEGEERVLDNITQYNDIPESIVQLKYPQNVAKNIDLQLNSKNLIPYPYAATTQVINGVTFTVNDDGSITANGTATADAFFAFFTTNKYFNVEIGKTYTVSDLSMPSGSTLDIYYLQFKYVDTDTNITYLTGRPKQFTFKATQSNIRANVVVRSGQTVNNVVSRPQIELGSVATAYTPYISDFSTVNVTACGKNLIPYPYYQKGTITLNGGTFVINDDGSITASGTPTDFSAVYLAAGIEITDRTNRKYTLSLNGTSTNLLFGIVLFANKDGTGYKGEITSSSTAPSKTFSFADYPTANYYTIRLSKANNNVEMSGTVYPQLELGSTATSYEQYQGQTYTSTSDGKVSGISSIYPITNIFTDNSGALITIQGGAYKEILPSTGKNGITKIYQEMISSDVDENIKPENIKKDVSILGTTGDYICNYSYDETTKELVLLL